MSTSTNHNREKITRQISVTLRQPGVFEPLRQRLHWFSAKEPRRNLRELWKLPERRGAVREARARLRCGSSDVPSLSNARQGRTPPKHRSCYSHPVLLLTRLDYTCTTIYIYEPALLLASQVWFNSLTCNDTPKTGLKKTSDEWFKFPAKTNVPLTLDQPKQTCWALPTRYKPPVFTPI